MEDNGMNFAVAAASGYAIHEGGPEDDELEGRFWWSRCRDGWSGVETSEGEWGTAQEAEADAVRAVAEEVASGDVVLQPA